jgi:F-type H+-transporting ATPase subunit b
MRRHVSLIAFIAFGLCGTPPLFAQSEHVAPPQPAPAQAAVHARAAHNEHAQVATQNEAAGNLVNPSDVHTEHAAEGHGEHAGAHEEEDVSFSDINWAYGLLGESDDAEPSLLFRPKGMPAPFLATFINWLVLMGLLVAFAKKQLPAALKKRKANLVQGMEEAARVKAQAEAHLAELETKLSHVDEEIEQLKSDMKRQSEVEREKILREAEERRARMERDAARLIMTELEAAKEQLRREVVTAALQKATDQVSRQVTGGDQERLFQEALGSLKGLPNKSLGGRA